MSSDLSQLHEKLDKNYELTYEVMGDVKAVKQHLANLNGSVKRHEANFVKVYSEFEKQQKIVGERFVVVEDRVKKGEANWLKGQGIVIALSVGGSLVVTGVGVLVSLKSLGLI